MSPYLIPGPSSLLLIVFPQTMGWDLKKIVEVDCSELNDLTDVNELNSSPL